MAKKSKVPARPMFSYDDHDKLTQIAERAMLRDAFLAQKMLDKLDRAEVVEASALPGDVVRVGSHVDFVFDGQKRRAEIVFPAHANADEGRLSIMTPLAAAMLGLAEDQTVEWKTRDGKTQSVTIASVENDVAARLEVA